jgi:hypothetical protein
MSLLFALAAFSRPAAAQVFEAVGERALGMGGAFVGVADDATATYWNPAGLATGRTFDTCVGRARAEGFPADGPSGAPPAEGSRASSFCLGVPSLGVSYYTVLGTAVDRPISPTAVVPGDRQDLRPGEVRLSRLSTRQAGLTLVQSVLPHVVVGATLKYVRGTAAVGQGAAGASASSLLDAADGLDGPTEGAFDADVGLMVSLGPLRLGATVKNLREPGFEADDGTVLRLTRQARVGVALRPGGEALLHASQDGWILAVDMDVTRTPTVAGDRRMAAAGVERWLLGHRLGLRGGVRADTVGAARAVATAGLSVGLRASTLLEAHVVGGRREGDRGWGVGVRAGF